MSGMRANGVRVPLVTQQRMRDVVGRVPKPRDVWQRQFDGNDDVLRKLAAWDWNEIPEWALRDYVLDLTYLHVDRETLQPDLFAHVFPACLKFWYDSLMRNDSAELGDADFHRALLHGGILERMLTGDQRQKCLALFRDGLLDRLDAERGFTYRRPGKSANAWIARFNSIGLLAPIVADIWTGWWSMSTPGRAVCAIMYATGLIYSKDENPIYLAWTRDEGGGGPYLTEWDAAEYERSWLEANVEFLRTTLTPGYLIERVAGAASLLDGEPEARLARRIAGDACDRADAVASRIAVLLASLAAPALGKGRPDLPA